MNNKEIPIRERIRRALNKRVGSVISTSVIKDVPDRHQIHLYFSQLKRDGHIEKVAYGKYRVLHKIITKQQNIKKERNSVTLRQAIINYLEEKGIDIENEKIPSKVVSVLSRKTRRPKGSITSTIYNIRQERSIDLFKCNSRRNILSKKTPFYKYCVKKNITRAAPSSEREACTNIIDVLMNTLPKGGAGMIIGTPTPFCASVHDQHNLLLTDNFEVALALKFTTNEIPTIVVGDAINPERAQLKVEHWRSNNSTGNFNIIQDCVDGSSFTYYVTRLAEHNNLSKVVLMSSGVWSCVASTRNKYNGLNFNFKDPSMFLTSKYKNLHIVAMVNAGPRNGFDIHYLNNGDQRIV